MIEEMIHRCFRAFFPKTAVFMPNVRILAQKHGQLHSIYKGESIRRDGRPLPWYTYPAIEYLETLDFSNCDVFEFGAGNSSRYWAERARTVTSVEDDPAWFRRVEAQAAANQRALLRPDAKAYVDAIAESGTSYDVIAIDGKYRVDCTRASIARLAPGGMIVLDNSDRQDERQCSSMLRDAKFFQVDFCGFGPLNGYCWSTSVFFRPDFSLPRIPGSPRPVGGLPG